jgi:hypothetical protein
MGFRENLGWQIGIQTPPPSGPSAKVIIYTIRIIYMSEELHGIYNSNVI